jgi:hypothetical protein
MNILQPPSRASLAQNLRLLADDWRLGSGIARYFMVSQMLSLALMALCAAGSILAIIAEDLSAYLGLLAASAICFVHTVGTWTVLRRRFFVRYQLL